MPRLDVSEAFDPSMMDSITVLRRATVVGNSGRQTTTTKAISTQAVVTAASPNDLQRLPEEEYMLKSISIYTMFRLQGPTVDEVGNQTLPDQVLWHGSLFVVRALNDFSGFGRGFVNAIAVSVQAVDPPLMPEPVGSA